MSRSLLVRAPQHDSPDASSSSETDPDEEPQAHTSKRNAHAAATRIIRHSLFGVLALLLCLFAYEVWPHPTLSQHGGEVPALAGAQTTKAALTPRTPREADGCHSVYIDCGSNMGHQQRKLYSPQLYPEALVKPHFDAVFGNGSRMHVCSFGFEANPRHTAYLREVEAAYQAAGYPYHVYTETGVAIKNDTLTFESPTNSANEDNAEWNAVFLSPGQAVTAPSDRVWHIPVVELGWWVRHHVLERKLPEAIEQSPYGLPKVAMKIDVEGMEFTLIANLLAHGVYCELDFFYSDTFPYEDASQIGAEAAHWEFLHMLEFQPTCKVRGLRIDDETYHNDKFPLPAPQHQQ